MEKVTPAMNDLTMNQGPENDKRSPDATGRTEEGDQQKGEGIGGQLNSQSSKEEPFPEEESATPQEESSWTEEDTLANSPKEMIKQLYNATSKLLGEGASAYVYEAQLPENFAKHCCLTVAVKVYKEKPEVKYSTQNATDKRNPLAIQELKAKHLRSPYLLPVLYHSFHCGGCSYYATVTPKMDGGDLRHMLNERNNNLDWKARVRIAYQVALALQTLHTSMPGKRNRRVIVHRDVSTTNILIDQNLNARLSDYGLAVECKPKDRQFTYIGSSTGKTEGYADPSAVDSGEHSASSDWFAYGVVLLELLTGREPSNRGRALYRDLVNHLLIKVDYDLLMKLADHQLENLDGLNLDELNTFPYEEKEVQKKTLETWSSSQPASFAADIMWHIAAHCVSAVKIPADRNPHCYVPIRNKWLGLKGSSSSTDLQPVILLRELCQINDITEERSTEPEDWKCLGCFAMEKPTTQAPSTLDVEIQDSDKPKHHTLSLDCDPSKCHWYCFDCSQTGELIMCPTHGKAAPLIGGNNVRALLIQGTTEEKYCTVAVENGEKCLLTDLGGALKQSIRLMQDVLTDSRITGINLNNLKVVSQSNGEEIFKTLCSFVEQFEDSVLLGAAGRLSDIPGVKLDKRSLVKRVYAYIRYDDVIRKIGQAKLSHSECQQLMEVAAHINKSGSFTMKDILAFKERHHEKFILDATQLGNCLDILTKSCGLPFSHLEEKYEVYLKKFLVEQGCKEDILEKSAEALYKCFQKLPDGMLWVYYVGHGDEWCGQTLDSIVGGTSHIPSATALLESTATLVANVMVVIDCCHSEQYKPKVQPYTDIRLTYNTFNVITCCTVTQEGICDFDTVCGKKILYKPARFTRFFVDGLRSALQASTSGSRSMICSEFQEMYKSRSLNKCSCSSCKACKTYSSYDASCKECEDFRKDCTGKRLISLPALMKYVSAHLCRMIMQPGKPEEIDLPVAYFYKKKLPPFLVDIRIGDKRYLKEYDNLPSEAATTDGKILMEQLQSKILSLMLEEDEALVCRQLEDETRRDMCSDVLKSDVKKFISLFADGRHLDDEYEALSRKLRAVIDLVQIETEFITHDQTYEDLRTQLVRLFVPRATLAKP